MLQDSAMVTEASNLRLHVQPRWLRCISIPASSLSALQNLVLPLPPRTGSRAFTEVNVLMSETDWYCSAVRRGVDAVFMCMNDCVCVHGWCSGLAELQQWLSPSEPNLAPVCWWALLTFCPHWLLWSVELTISPGQTERRCWSVSLLASKTFSVSRWEHIKLFLHLFWVSEGLQLIVFWRRFNWQSFVWSIN